MAIRTISPDVSSEAQDVRAAEMMTSPDVRNKERGMVRFLANKVKLAYISQS